MDISIYDGDDLTDYEIYDKISLYTLFSEEDNELQFMDCIIELKRRQWLSIKHDVYLPISSVIVGNMLAIAIDMAFQPMLLTLIIIMIFIQILPIIYLCIVLDLSVNHKYKEFNFKINKILADYLISKKLYSKNKKASEGVGE